MAEGWLVCASLDGRQLLVDWRSSRELERGATSGKPRGNRRGLQLLTVVSIGAKQPAGR